MALLRLLTNRAVMKAASQSQAGAWQIYTALRGSPRVEWAAEPVGLEAGWRGFSSRASASVQRWTDDYLAAFALVRSLRMVTFDAGFKSYPALTVELLVMPVQVGVPTS